MYRIVYAAVHQDTDPAGDFLIVRFHPLRDPVQHDAYEAVFVEFRNEGSVFLRQDCAADFSSTTSAIRL